jgi:predicted outer membrane repeat protein
VNGHERNGNGGSFNVRSSSVNIKDCDFKHNIASGSGGAISSYNSTLAMTRTTMTNNSAETITTGKGGGAMNIDLSIVTFIGSNDPVYPTTFDRNKATNGGVIRASLSSITANSGYLKFHKNNAVRLFKHYE